MFECMHFTFKMKCYKFENSYPGLFCIDFPVPWYVAALVSKLQKGQCNNFIYARVVCTNTGLITLSSLYIHFNTLKTKAVGKHCEKRWNCSKWAISPFSTNVFYVICILKSFNPLPYMPILGSSNSAANKDMMSKILTNGNTNFWLSRTHYGKRKKNCSLRAISSFPTMFSKAVCCRCGKMSIYRVKG